MIYTRKEHKRDIINGMASSFIVAVFIGVLYDTGSWLIALFVSGLYGLIAFWASWFFTRDKKNLKENRKEESSLNSRPRRKGSTSFKRKK